MLTFEEILAAPAEVTKGSILEVSRENRPVVGHRFGHGRFRISLIAGCHADEPIGPRLLARLVRCLASLDRTHPALGEFSWWIVPHANPDGATANAAWTDELEDGVDPVAYLRHVVREMPGDDLEFGFPRAIDDTEARSENRGIDSWWGTAGGAFDLHASLHGMALAHGPWFLVEPEWADRCGLFRRKCADAVAALGYRLHDVDRGGEKGFVRLAEGFSTRPDSRKMADFFRAQGDEETAALFRPTSMEAIRRLGGDPLTLVSEMPLFIAPPDHDGPSTSEDLERGKRRLRDWRQRLATGTDTATILAEFVSAGIRSMPIADQMRLQWEMILAGIEQVRAEQEEPG